MTNLDRIKTIARGMITEQIDRRTTDLGNGLSERVTKLLRMSEMLRGQGQTITANLVDSAAFKLDRVSSYLRNTDGDRFIQDVETIARNQPLATAAAGFAGGLVAARLLKAGGYGTQSYSSGAEVPLSEDDDGE